MDIADLVEIALANSDEERVEVAALEPADIGMEAISGLAQLIAELVDNAVAFSGPEDTVRITGLHEQGDYLISISDRGVGIPEHLITELNRALEDPSAPSGTEPRLGIALVARLAARHDIDVRLVPGAPGTTARVKIPGRLVGEPAKETPEETPTPEAGHRLPPRPSQPDDVFARADEVEEMAGLTRFERGYHTGSGVIAMSEEGRRKAEAFLEKVFSSLVRRPGVTERPPARTPGNGNGNANKVDRPSDQPRDVPERGGNVTTLRVRVPGENFSLTDDDPSTIAAEGAIDISSALSRYAEGRRSAEEADESD